MRVLAASLVLALAAFAPAAVADGYQLDPYVGGRVVTHVAEDPGWHLFTAARNRTSYTYAWPGVWFEARFTGDAVAAKIDDDQSNYYLYVDGSHKLTLTRPGRATVALEDLGPGPHVVRLEKSSETQSSTGTFDGFFVASRKDALPAPQYDRHIEFIGDSFTLGYGNTSRGQVCTVDDVRDTTDTSQAFPPLAARHFNAAYRINAYSGRGVVRNYDNLDPGVTLPVLYQYALFDKTTRADDAGWTPDVVVIGLGTNDFSTPLKPGEPWADAAALHADFVKTDAAFVTSLRAKWPAAHIILLGTPGFDNLVIAGANDTADALKAAGLADFEVLDVSGLDYQACHGHPSLKDDGAIAQLLIERLSTLPGFAPATASVPAPVP